MYQGIEQNREQPHSYIFGTLNEEQIKNLQPGDIIEQFPLDRLFRHVTGIKSLTEVIPSSTVSRIGDRKNLQTLLEESTIPLKVKAIDLQAGTVVVTYRKGDIPNDNIVELRRYWIDRKNDPDGLIPMQSQNDRIEISTTLTFQELQGNLQDKFAGKILTIIHFVRDRIM